ncbi:SDR family NAD(P)-dependent oxidoreductase [Fodinicola feengrottensis]|uniref:SDR family oxidoreductase n=1 Tax=Fodinicola feengrottensis TaxID=435914 RepID=A0ABP4V4L6_9ACTN|nr:SDR family oxidoreductase [Fodinicola feengrottensis]
MSERHVRAIGAVSAGLEPGRGRLAGRRILVVGGGQRTYDAATDPIGNGRAIAVLFAREGAHVAVANRGIESARETVAMIDAQGGKAFPIQADISGAADVTRMIEEACEGLDGLDGLVLNAAAGVGALGLDGVDLDEWDKTFDVNVRGTMLCCRAALPRLDDDSSIVFISSVAGYKSGSRLAAYEASKAALGGLMRHVALEASRRGIRANIVSPGAVDTPIGRAAAAGRPSRMETRLPFGRQATGWEVAYATLFLTSEESAYITAQTLQVDSGMTGL